jgi:hypothetical protein
MEICPAMHLETPFIFSWSCHPKKSFAGIISRASINSLELLIMMAVILGIGGSYLKASSTAFSFSFSIMEQRNSYYFVKANYSGDFDLMSKEVLSTWEISYFREGSSFKWWCTLRNAYICIYFIIYPIIVKTEMVNHDIEKHLNSISINI